MSLSARKEALKELKDAKALLNLEIINQVFYFLLVIQTIDKAVINL